MYKIPYKDCLIFRGNQLLSAEICKIYALDQAYTEQVTLDYPGDHLW